jgi:hypothetical protein
MIHPATPLNSLSGPVVLDETNSLRGLYSNKWRKARSNSSGPLNHVLICWPYTYLSYEAGNDGRQSTITVSQRRSQLHRRRSPGYALRPELHGIQTVGTLIGVILPGPANRSLVARTGPPEASATGRDRNPLGPS